IAVCRSFGAMRPARAPPRHLGQSDPPENEVAARRSSLRICAVSHVPWNRMVDRSTSGNTASQRKQLRAELLDQADGGNLEKSSGLHRGEDRRLAILPSPPS